MHCDHLLKGVFAQGTRNICSVPLCIYCIYKACMRVTITVHVYTTFILDFVYKVNVYYIKNYKPVAP